MRLLLKIFSPKEIPSKKTEWNWRVRFQCWMMRKLLPIYKRSAINDTILLSETQIIHNLRDYWYEEEARRFGINTAQDIERCSMPFYINRRYRHSALFKWTETLLVYSNEKSYCIKRGKFFSIETDMEGLLRASTSNDIIMRTEFAVKKTTRQTESDAWRLRKESPLSSETAPKQPKQKSSAKDTVQNGPDDPLNPSQDNLSQFNGFVENNMF